MTRERWWVDMSPFDAAAHIASRLDSLLAGVENEETLAECQAAAAVWMRDLETIRSEQDARTEAGGALAGALEVYADPKHWAIRRNGTMYADCIWIGPGATDRVNPDGPGVARAALEKAS